MGFARSEIATLRSQGVISEVNNTSHDEEKFLSNVFLRPEPNNDFWMILNLTQLNRFVEYRHFKTEGLSSALNMLKPGVFMASVDLREAYHSCPIACEHRKYLRFLWEGKKFEFTCFPNGLACAPLYFTKISRPIFSSLRYQSVVYIDDTYLQGDTLDECTNNVRDNQSFPRTGLHDQLGQVCSDAYPMHPFLGFGLNSLTMTVSVN